MDNAIYAALTRQSGLMNEMRAVANNMANSATTGFRREGVVFSEHLTAIGPGRETLSMANARGREVDLTRPRCRRPAAASIWRSSARGSSWSRPRRATASPAPAPS